jgi:hypothetical protein
MHSKTDEYQAGFNEATAHCTKVLEATKAMNAVPAQQIAWDLHGWWKQRLNQAELLDEYGLCGDRHIGAANAYRQHLDSWFPGVFK